MASGVRRQRLGWRRLGYECRRGRQSHCHERVLRRQRLRGGLGLGTRGDHEEDGERKGAKHGGLRRW